MQILGLLGMYFDAVVVEFKNSNFSFRLDLSMLFKILRRVAYVALTA